MSTPAGRDHPQPGVARSVDVEWHRPDPSTPPVDSGLPSGSPWWLPTICLVPSLTEPAFAWLTRGLTPTGLETWAAFAAWITDSGIAEAEPGVEPVALVVRPEWFSVLDAALDAVLDSEETRARLLASPEPRLGPSRWIRAGRWARLRGQWDVLEDVWLVLSEDADDIPSEALRDFVDLPDDARRDYPILSWATAVAEAQAVQPASQQARMFLNRLRLDSALLHADWAQRPDTNAAVAAGTVRIVGQRGLPQSSHPLDAAWRTKADVDLFIDERSRDGKPPGRVTSSFFHVISAWVSLFRADLAGAVEEARWAAIFAESASIATFAAAIETFATSMAGDLEPFAGVDEPPAAIPDQYQFGGLRQIAAVLAQLASGRRALQALDRDGVERALAATAPETTMVSGVWAVRVSLAAFHGAIWGDPALSLHKLFADLATQPMGVREQDEPMGGLLTGRAREMLLDKIGHFGAAAQCADSLDERFRVISQARSRLWSGQLGAAVQIIEKALPDPDLLHSDRLQLLVIRGAATALDGSITAEIRKRTLSALRTMLPARDFLPIALLPGAARDAVLEMAELLADEPGLGDALALLKQRLGTDDDNAPASGRLFHLTDRETVLLPLLATDMTVTEIAKQLHVSVHTVRKQVATLREKFQAPTRAELVRKAGVYGSIL